MPCCWSRQPSKWPSPDPRLPWHEEEEEEEEEDEEENSEEKSS